MKLRHLLLGRKVMTNLDNQIKRQRHYFANKGPSTQGYGFSSRHVWMWELDYKESWALKNWCFELRCWKRLLGIPWTARTSNPSILKEINPEYSLEGLMAEAETLILWPADEKNWLIFKRAWCWERLKAGEGDDRGWDGWMASPAQWTCPSGSWGWTGKAGVLKSMGSQRTGHDWVTELN